MDNTELSADEVSSGIPSINSVFCSNMVVYTSVAVSFRNINHVKKVLYSHSKFITFILQEFSAYTHIYL